jgi:hypothetical protein
MREKRSPSRCNCVIIFFCYVEDRASARVVELARWELTGRSTILSGDEFSVSHPKKSPHCAHEPGSAQLTVYPRRPVDMIRFCLARQGMSQGSGVFWTRVIRSPSINRVVGVVLPPTGPSFFLLCYCYEWISNLILFVCLLYICRSAT